MLFERPEKGYPKNFETMKGDMVRSVSEAYIANFLWKNHVNYQYEKPLILAGYTIKPDFYLFEYHFYVEFWGMLNQKNPQYWKSFRWKVEMYEKFQIKFLPLVPEDLPYLKKVFRDKLLATLSSGK
jgi:hypothetical protein